MDTGKKVLEEIIALEREFRTAQHQMDRYFTGQVSESPQINNLIHRIRRYHLPPGAKKEAEFRLANLQHRVMIYQSQWERNKHYGTNRHQKQAPRTQKPRVRMDELWERQQGAEPGSDAERYSDFRKRLYAESQQLGSSRVKAYYDANSGRYHLKAPDDNQKG